MFDLIREDLALFEQRLATELTSRVSLLETISSELIAAGGKRLRPSLSFLAGKLLSAPPEAAQQVALSVELLHSASLLHDDLIDDAETRRGRPAAFRRYGNSVSIMTGDFLLARVLGLLARVGSPELTALLAETATRICEGEVLQFQMAASESYTFDGYRQVIEGKTAVLLAAALEGVALLGGAADEEREALRLFGMRYGRAFQMQDDYLDLMGDDRELGKPVGGDLREGKATYPVLVLLEQGVEEAAAILRRRAAHEGDARRMAELVRRHGADTRTHERIAAEAEAAVAALEVFPVTPARLALSSLAERELERVN